MRISDWSSDVCSSDLDVALEGHDASEGHVGRVMSLTGRRITNTVDPYDLVRKLRASVLVLGPLVARERSEELRGGKECVSKGRSRVAPNHETKKHRRHMNTAFNY